MTDYTELVKALRFETDYVAVEKTMRDAAAAIEELQGEIRESMQKCAECGDEQEQKAKELQARLGEAENSAERWKDMYLTKHEPKLGEWQKAKPHGVVTYSDGYAECSHCHEAIWLGWGMNFCPHCGTQNKIIDPDDYDGAKMEVRDDKA